MKRKIFIVSMLVCAVVLSVWAIQPPTRVIGDTQFVPYRIVATIPKAKIYLITGYNSGAAQFIMIFNTATPPTNGQVGQFCFPVGAQQYFNFDAGYYGADLDACSVCNSSTANTNTLGATNCSFQAVLAN